MTQAQPVALWQQLQAVALALVQVRKGTSGTAALDEVMPALRPGVQALLFHVLRQLGRAQALRDRLVHQGMRVIRRHHFIPSQSQRRTQQSIG